MADIKPGDRIAITAVVESEGHDDRHVIVRIGGRPVQVPVPPQGEDTGRWTRLREYITTERAAQDQLAADHAEDGHDWSSERAYGRVEALDQLMTMMDGMEAER